MKDSKKRFFTIVRERGAAEKSAQPITRVPGWKFGQQSLAETWQCSITGKTAASKVNAKLKKKSGALTG